MPSPLARWSAPRRSTVAPSVAGGAALAALAGLAAANWIYKRTVEASHPPRGRFVTVRGTRLHYVDRGAGPTVVLLHGNGDSIDDWSAAGVLDMLSAHHRVIAFDRPGFGWSKRPRGRAWTAEAQADVIARALAALGVTRPVVVGHSFGALVATALALRPEVPVDGLVLVSGYLYPEPRPEAPFAAIATIPVVGRVLGWTVAPLMSALVMPRVLRTLFAPRPIDHRFSERFPISMSLRPSQLRAAAEDAAGMMAAARRLSPRYGELAVPIEVITGTRDDMVRPEGQSLRLAHDLGARLTEVPDGGHMIAFSGPGAILKAVERLVDREAVAPRRVEEHGPIVPEAVPIGRL